MDFPYDAWRMVVDALKTGQFPDWRTGLAMVARVIGYIAYKLSSEPDAPTVAAAVILTDADAGALGDQVIAAHTAAPGTVQAKMAFNWEQLFLELALRFLDRMRERRRGQQPPAQV